jgi:IS4 transposase
MDERKCFIEQLKYVRKNDILLFDRGYYSEELINILNNKNIDYIFRTKKNFLKNKYLKENNLNEYIYYINNKKYKIINYKIHNEGEEYFLLTSLINKDLEELKNLYKKRWRIETHFKESKHTTSLNEINSKSLDNLLKEINIHNYVYILYYYFNYCIEDIAINERYELNHKLSLEIFIEDILFIMIYKKKIKKYILFIIDILPKTYKQKKDRHYKRESIKKFTKWYFRDEDNRKNKKKCKTKIL